MHVAWISDSPNTPSGFGNVTAAVCERLARRGHRITILGWQATTSFEWKGCKVVAIGADPMGSDSLYRLLLRQRTDAVIALGDVWWLPYFAAPHLRRQMELTDTPWILYFPIDGDVEGEQLPVSWLELLREVDIPIAMSQYGQRITTACGIACKYIPHGVDLQTFCPPLDREEAKARAGVQGKFVVLSDSRNQPRKMLPRLLDIFAKFAVDRPDTLLHLHTDPDDEFTRSGYYSYSLQQDIQYLGLGSRVRFTPGLSMKADGGIPLNELATYYKAADVHLLTSSGEGFGLPNLQAAAAGVVPFAADYSASHELVSGHGEAVAVKSWTKNEFGIRRALIDVDDAVDKLAHYYENRDLLRERSIRARQFALKFGWEQVVDQWEALLRSLTNAPRRIRRLPNEKVESINGLRPFLAAPPAGVSMKVTVAKREYGRLEAAIFADSRGRGTDVCIPFLPKPCQAARVRVPKRMGYFCLAEADQPVFKALRTIFPVMEGWIPCTLGSRGEEYDYLKYIQICKPEDARYELAQSVLLLNLTTSLERALLIDAAFLGIPCIGNDIFPEQVILWPELVVHDEKQAIDKARMLLTDAAVFARVSSNAREACVSCYAPCEYAMAECLRRLYSEQAALVGNQ